MTPGTAVGWLSPGVASVVAPSGMLEPTTPEAGPDGPDAAPPAVEPVVVPALPLFDEAVLQLVDRPDPPPSNAAFEFVLGQGTLSGLMPGVLISVEPSGMLPRPDEFEADEELFPDGTPNGDVGPMPGVVVVCAWAATMPITQTMTDSRYNGTRIGRPQLVVDLILIRLGE